MAGEGKPQQEDVQEHEKFHPERVTGSVKSDKPGNADEVRNTQPPPPPLDDDGGGEDKQR